MENYNNLDSLFKIIIGLIGSILTLRKLMGSFADSKRKQEIKLDLEILEKLKENNEIDTTKIKKRISQNMENAYSLNKDSNWYNFILGIVITIGFGVWTIDIYSNSERFNGWIILTVFCFVAGISMVLGLDKEVTKEKTVFMKFGLFDKSNIRFGIIISIFTGILTPILYFKQNGPSFGLFISGLFFLIGLATIIRNIKRLNE